MLVYYSLGNFVSWTSLTGELASNQVVGGMAKVSIGLNEKGNVVIKDNFVRALVCHLSYSKQGCTVYYLSDYTDELAVKNAITENNADVTPAYCKALCDKVWGDKWK